MDGVLADKKEFEKSQKRFDAVRSKAEKLGVLDINFSGAPPSAGLASYERTLEIIEQNRGQLIKNVEEG